RWIPHELRHDPEAHPAPQRLDGAQGARGLRDDAQEGRSATRRRAHASRSLLFGCTRAAPTADRHLRGRSAPRAHRGGGSATARVYKPEEDEEYPIGGQRYEEPAEEAEAAVEKKEDE